MARNPNLIYGVHPVVETVRSGKHLEKIFIQKNLKNNQIIEVKRLTKELQIPTSFVPVEKLNRFTTGNHQGVVALVSPIQYFPMDQIIAQVYEARSSATHAYAGWYNRCSKFRLHRSHS